MIADEVFADHKERISCPKEFLPLREREEVQKILRGARTWYMLRCSPI